MPAKMNHLWNSLQKRMSDKRTQQVTRPRKGGKGTAPSEIVVQRLTARCMTFADCRLHTAHCRPQTADCYLRDINCKIIHIENIRIKVTSSSIKQRQKKNWKSALAWGAGYEVDFSRVKLRQPRCQVVFGCKVSEEMASTDSRYDSFFFFLIGYRCMIKTSSRLIPVY